MTADAPAVDPFDAFPDAPADFLATATAHLTLAAEGNDVAGNLDAALRTILTAASRPDTPLVAREAVDLARATLAGVSEAVAAHFGDYPCPGTVNVALGSAGNVLRTLQVPPDAVSADDREMLPVWFDWTAVLLAEMDMVTRYRRLSARVGRDFNGYGPAPSPPPRKLH